MTRVVPGLRSVLVAGMVLGLGGVAGCGSDGSSSASSAASASANSGTIDRSSGSTPPTAGVTPPSSQPPGDTSGTVTLSWEAPTENSDGSALVDLRGYKVHYGTGSRDYTDTIRVSNPGLTNYVVQNLPAGTYYFAVTAYNSAGR